MSTSKTFYINAKKMVQLQQVEVQAESEEVAIETYMDMAKAGGLAVDDYEWWTLSKGDLDVEYHGEAEEAPF